MSTAFTFVVIVLAVIGIAGLTLYFWARNKVRRGVAWFKVTALEAAVKELRQKQETETKPDQQPDAERASLIIRVETAHTMAKAAYEGDDFAGVSQAADAVLAELFELVKKQAEKEAREEEQARLAASASQPDAPLALPAPTDKPAGESTDNR